MRWLFLCLLCFTHWILADNSSIFVDVGSDEKNNVELYEFKSEKIQQQAISLAKSLRCPQCKNQNLVESNSPIALDLRLIVYEMINQGRSEQQIVDYMKARYGEFVLYKPEFSARNTLLWGLPVLVLFLFIIRSAMLISRRNSNSNNGD